MFSQEELAYIAGVLDSDGCISLASKHVVPKITVANTKEALPQWFHDRLGGHLSQQGARNLRWRSTWYWILQGQPAIDLLKLVRQWLVLKREQANVVIDFWAKTQSMRQHVGRGHPRSPELREIDTKYSARMHTLNQRGV